MANASEASGTTPSAGPIRGLLAVFASAFTSQGLGALYHGGPALLAGTSLVAGVLLYLVSFFWHRITRHAANNKLVVSAIELGSDARWWAAVLLVVFLYIMFSPIILNLANISDLAVRIYPPGNQQSNKIAWNFEDTQHPPFFLGYQKTDKEDTRLISFQAHGRNNSDAPITNIKGFVKSLITNKELPIYFLLQGTPVAPDDTNGIPPFAEFDIATTEDKTEIVNGIIVSPTLNEAEMATFTFEFDYNGDKFIRTFTRQEVENQRKMFNNIADVDKSSIPHVTRKDKGQK